MRAALPFAASVESVGCGLALYSNHMPALETLNRRQRPRVVGRLLIAQDRGAFADRHADVVQVAKRQRREPAAVDGRLEAFGQLVKNSFMSSTPQEIPKSG